MTLEIVSPETMLFHGKVTSVTLPGAEGSFQILNHHAPIVATLQQGEIKIVADSFTFSKEAETKFKMMDQKTYTLPIMSGTLEMNDNKIIALVD